VTDEDATEAWKNQFTALSARYPQENPALPSPDIGDRFIDAVAERATKGAFPISRDRTIAAVDTIIGGFTAGEIYNVVFKKAKDTASRAFEDAGDVLRSSFTASRGHTPEAEFFDALNLYQINSALSAKKRLDRFLKKPSKPFSSRADFSLNDVNPEVIEQVSDFIDGTAPFAQLLKDMKPMIVKGRKPATSPTKAQMSQMERARDPRLKTCSVCFQEIITKKSGAPKRHGFQVISAGYGRGHLGAYHTGPCPGTDFLHYGLSDEGTKWALADAQRRLVQAEKDIRWLESRPVLPWVSESRYADAKQKDIHPGDPQDYRLGAPSYEQYHKRKLTLAEQYRSSLLHSIDFYGDKIKTWELRPNPPYSGYDKTYYAKPLPKDPTKLSYDKKRDALNVFLDWNRRVVDDTFRGPDYSHGPEGFDNINHAFDLKGKRRVNTLAKAAWWALPAGSPYYLEDIDLDMLNSTDVALRAEVGFTLPDYQEEQRLIAEQMQYYEDRYLYPDEDEEGGEVPF
jgi:hypothetical protein